MTRGEIQMDASFLDLRGRYTSERLVTLRQLAAGEEVERIIEESPAWPKQSVCARRDDGVKWLSQPVLQDSFLYAWFLSPRVLQMVRTIACFTAPLAATECWTNLYQAGEHITPHRDAAGSVQLLLSLVSPARECGGSFVASVQARPCEVILGPVDAVLFEATSVEHYTTPLRASPLSPAPLRMTAVMRFYFAAH
jgi:hypothetical protein